MCREGSGYKRECLSYPHAGVYYIGKENCPTFREKKHSTCGAIILININITASHTKISSASNINYNILRTVDPTTGHRQTPIPNVLCGTISMKCFNGKYKKA